MKNLLILFTLALMTGSLKSQNLPACDSLTIDCCIYTPPGSDTLMLTASNSASIIFDYPSFVLFNLNMDTIAIETVSYFGIGTGPQNHYMTLIAPLVLPFSGYINLYTSFNNSLACSFPITIPDTTTGIPG